MTSRRSFLTACIATCCAPAIVRASSLMPLSVRPLPFVGLGTEIGATLIRENYEKLFYSNFMEESVKLLRIKDSNVFHVGDEIIKFDNLRWSRGNG